MKLFASLLSLFAAIILSSCNSVSNKPSTSNLKSQFVSHVYFIQHAETERNAGISDRDDNFSPLGWQQVQALNDNLRSLNPHFDNIYLSSMWRTKATVSSYLEGKGGEYRNLDSYIDQDLSECCWDAGSNNPDPANRLAERIKQYIYSQGRPVNVLIVGHYFSGKILMRSLLGYDISPVHAQLQVYDFPVN